MFKSICLSSSFLAAKGLRCLKQQVHVILINYKTHTHTHIYIIYILFIYIYIIYKYNEVGLVSLINLKQNIAAHYLAVEFLMLILISFPNQYIQS